MSSFEEKLALLPDDLRALVKELPADEAATVIDQLLLATELDFRALTEQDVATIKAGPPRQATLACCTCACTPQQLWAGHSSRREQQLFLWQHTD